LGRWLKEAEDDDGHAFCGNGTLTPEQAEIRTLKGQVKSIKEGISSVKVNSLA
jgi:transposase